MKHSEHFYKERGKMLSSTSIISARLRVLEAYSIWREGWQKMCTIIVFCMLNFSTAVEYILCCSQKVEPTVATIWVRIGVRMINFDLHNVELQVSWLHQITRLLIPYMLTEEASERGVIC